MIEKTNKSKPTLRDVAERMNVSVMTISKVINGHSDISEKTKKEVWDTIREIGYTPNFMAANMRKKHSNVIALVLSDLSQPFFSEIIYEYEQILNDAGYQVLIFNSYEDSKKELELLKKIATINVAGLIVDIAQHPENSIQYLRTMGIPFILSNRYVSRDEDYYVVADNVMAGYEATKYLIKKKPSAPVLYLNGPESSPTADRFEGYVKALKESSVEIQNEWVFSHHYKLEDAYETGKKICKLFKPPFSVFCATDQIAIGFMRAVAEAKYSIPKDVAVMGVDDISVSGYVVPALTTISLPIKEIGKKSVEKLLALIEGRVVDVPREVIAPKLTERESA